MDGKKSIYSDCMSDAINGGNAWPTLEKTHEGWVWVIPGLENTLNRCYNF